MTSAPCWSCSAGLRPFHHPVKASSDETHCVMPRLLPPSVRPAATPPASPRCSRPGADVFRFNFSHGSQEDHAPATPWCARSNGRPAGPSASWPTCRAPSCASAVSPGPVMLEEGAIFTFDMVDQPGDASRVFLPHPELFGAVSAGTDAADRRRQAAPAGRAGRRRASATRVVAGGVDLGPQGRERAGCRRPIPALTEKDRRDLAFALALGRRLGGAVLRAAAVGRAEARS